MSLALGLPDIDATGDGWRLTWADLGLRMYAARVRESSDGVKALLTFEGESGSRMYGPVNANLTSARSHTEIANACAKRVNSLKSDDWFGLVSYGSAIVVKKWAAGPELEMLGSADRPFAPPEVLVPGFLPLDETTAVYGDGEGGKSLAVLLVGMCCAAGVALPWGVTPTRRTNVLYLDFETTSDTIHSRLVRLALGYGIEPPPIHYLRPEYGLVDSIDAIRRHVVEQQVGLVIVDSLSAAAKGSLNDDECARITANALRTIRATRLVVEHVSRDSALARNGRVDAYGSIFWRNLVRACWEIRKAEHAPQDVLSLGLYCRKRNDGPRWPDRVLRFRFDGEDGPIHCERGDVRDSPDLLARTSLTTRIREQLRQGAMPLDSLAEALGEKSGRVKDAIKHMRDVGRVQGGADGRGNAGVYGLLSDGH